MNKKVISIILLLIVAFGAGYYFGSQKSASDPVIASSAPTFQPTSAGSSNRSTSVESYHPDYVYNKNTHKFHYPDCSSVDEIANYNKVYWIGSREGLLKKHPSAVPCKKCNP